MEEIEKILIEHSKLYELEIQDCIKLIYQNEFGGGHLIRDKITSLNNLKDEYEKNFDNSDNLYEDIGNGLVRVNLKAYKGDLEILNDLFVESSNSITGSIESFNKKLNVLIKLTKQNIFKFNINDLNKFIKQYKDLNYPILSHSTEYKEKYKPSYRVIKMSLIEKLEDEYDIQLSNKILKHDSKTLTLEETKEALKI